MNVYGLHHDPLYWDDPWKFKPETFLDEDGQVVLSDHQNKMRQGLVHYFLHIRRHCEYHSELERGNEGTNWKIYG